MKWFFLLGILASTEAFIPKTCGKIPTNCKRSKYRSIDGYCNNLKNGWWGTPYTWYERILDPIYSDGIQAFPESKMGKPLPNARKLSLSLYPPTKVMDDVWTLIFMSFGQLISHDFALLIDGGVCCKDGKLTDKAKTDPRCAPITLPCSDYYSVPLGRQCLNFYRSETSRHGRKCYGAPEYAEQLTKVTAFLDASFLYGSNSDVAKKVRKFKGGRLATTERNGKEWYTQDSTPTKTCAIKAATEPCYFSGDVRVNQNPQLSILQTLFLRMHNKIADRLEALNKHWDDETIFQETRKIVIAVFQHITYYEYLPIALGKDVCLKKKLIYQNPTGFINDYNNTVNPNTMNEFSTAAFRFSHTNIVGLPKKYNESREPLESIRLSSHFKNPAVIEKGNNFEAFTIGLTTQQEGESDRFVCDEVTQYLFRDLPDGTLGLDLKAIDIHRGRDHGLGSYAQALRYCGLVRARSFEDFKQFIDEVTVDKLLKRFYDDYEDVDLTVGLTLEKINGFLGPTASCLFVEQFRRTRTGDFYFYENEGMFTKDQLNEIRRVTLASFICYSNTDIKSMQRHAFRLIGKANPVVKCSDIHTLDLSAWKDDKKA